EKYRSLFNISPSAILLLDLNGRLIDFNPATSDIFEKSFSSLMRVKFPFEVIVLEGEIKSFNNFLQIYHKGKKNNIFEIKVQISEKKIKWLEIFPSFLERDGRLYAIQLEVRDVTQKKQSRENLLKLTKALENSINSVLILNLNHRINYINASGHRLFGIKKGTEVLGKKITDFFPGRLKNEIKNILKTLPKEKQYKGFECEITNKAGKAIPLEVCFYVIEDTDKKTIGIVAVIQDISDRLEKERKLRESEERFRIVTQTAIDSIFIKDLTGHYLDVNPAMALLFKTSRENLIGKRDKDLFGIKESSRIHRDEKKIIDGNIIIEESEKDIFGEKITFHVVKVPLRDNTGRVVGIAGIARDITEIKKAQQAREESDLKFRLSFENSPDSILWIEPSTEKIIECNKSAERLLELSREKILGLKYSEIFSLRNGKCLKKDLKYSSGENEDELITKSGKRKIINISTSVICFKDLKIIQQILHDITEKKISEERLRQSEEKYRILVDNLSEALYSVKNGVFTSLSKTVFDIFGYTEEELIGTESWNLAVPEKREWIKDQMFEKASKNDYSPLQVECLRKDGSRCFIELRLSNKTGQNQFIGLIRDVTEEKNVKDSLRESKGQFYTLVENANDGILIIQDGKIRFANKMILRILDYSQEEILGKDFKSIIPKSLFPEAESLHVSIAETGDSLNSYETQFIRKNGDIVEVDISSGSVQFKGQPAIISIIRDVTEKKQMLLALNRAQKLEAAGNLAGQIAHDFNNLLAPIIAYPEIIKDM
ncbi:MAG TPA: PAS domain S-box protein, partial [Firmicutes bacterium]|nr:PAS domain S-box protein [Bacillota bacterium]